MIKIFTKDGCKACEKVIDLLERKNIEYKVVNLSKKENREARKFYRDNNFKLLPVVVADNWTVEGYNKRKLNKYLENELTVKEKKLIEKKLKDLGYIE